MSVQRQCKKKQKVISTISALAACAMTACAITGCTPYQLLVWCKGWLARRQLPRDDQEPDGEPWPAAGFPGPVKCRPLSTITELLTWHPPVSSSGTPALSPAKQQLSEATTSDSRLSFQAPPCTKDPCSSNVPLVLFHPAAPRGRAKSSSDAGLDTQQRPQLLACHDMMGGYLPQDALLSGADNHRHYRLWHWDCIDVFIYFSHHLVSIPTKGWIHAAHKHSVKVLGTFITEFGQGRQRCNRIFASSQSAETVADQLVAVAAHYGFEGWLVNIENSLSSQQVEVMKHFVGYLRARMAVAVKHSLVIWYDAVTTAGELRWQNKLSHHNGPFFDLADALFVNYTWTPDTLSDTITAAAARRTDIYMGIDVHGRGSYGGGGHNVGVALQAAAAAGLSAALFAPGWVYENLDKTKFIQLQEQWWTKVQSDWGCCHPVLHSLPFATSFNAGAGRGWFRNGQLVAQGTAAAAVAAAAVGDTDAAGGGCHQQPEQQQQQLEDAGGREVADGGSSGSGWFNMALTHTLPACRDPVTQQVVTGPVLGRLATSTAFNGGSCLVLHSQHPAAAAVQPSAPGPPTPTIGGDTPDTETTPLLQLFSAQVPVPHDMHLTVSWVYAAPAGRSSSSSHDSTKPRQHATAPPLWLMTEQPSGAAADALVSERVIHLIQDSSVLSQQQQQLSHGKEPPWPAVAVQAVLNRQQQHEEACLSPLEFVANGSGTPAGEGTEAAAVDSVWDVDLSSALCGCKWQRCSVQLPVKAGSTITGVGVAIQHHIALGSAGSRMLVHAVLGEVKIIVA